MSCGKLLFLTVVFATVSPLLAADHPFAKGTWDLEITGGYITPIRFSDDKFTEATAGVGYYLVDNLSLTAELQGYYADQPDKDALVAGAGLLLRWHVLVIDRFSLFIDGGGSVTYASREVPEFGTHFNFTGKGGLGMTYQLRDDLHLIAGVRYFHLSNGNLHGRDQNPSYDGIQFYAGIMWYF
jgi:hypothetical protein